MNKRQVPARAILLGSAFGFVVMLMRDVAPDQLFNFLLNSCGALMLFTYIFVVLAHFRFPYKDQALRGGAGAKLVAGGAGLAMLAVLIAMAFMPNKQPEMIASFACLVVIVVALVIKRSMRRAAYARREIHRRTGPHHLRTGMGRNGCARASRKVSFNSRLWNPAFGHRAKISRNSARGKPNDSTPRDTSIQSARRNGSITSAPVPR